jgi:exopolysaccharide biosynthesis polyprenyl glycosylphosphotransferase
VSNPRRQALLTAFKLFDVVLMVLAFGLATLPVLYETDAASITSFLSMRIRVNDFLIFLALLTVWHVTFSSFGLYLSHRLDRPRAEMACVIKATSLATGIMLVAALLFHITMVTPVFLTVFWSVSTTLVVLSRFTLRSLLRQARVRGRNLRLVLVVGTNSRALEFARKAESTPELGYRVIGFADDPWEGIEAVRNAGYDVVCPNLNELADYIKHNVVDEVVMALPIRSYYFHASRIASLCEEQGIIMRFPSALFDLKTARSRAEEFVEGDSLITLYTGTPDGWPKIMKRAIDFTASLAALILIAPLLGVVALLIRLGSDGPIIFEQKRMGLNKRIFSVLKFRTMVPDAEAKLAQLEHLNEVTGPVFKIKDDPRITPIGRFLRKTSIDELPQLINVLRGEMSLVGPRPLPVRDYKGFDKDWQRRRFSVRPGITCLWQVNGRSSIQFDQWMELDMQYIDRWSLWLDFKILAQTIPAVLRGSGAA